LEIRTTYEGGDPFKIKTWRHWTTNSAAPGKYFNDRFIEVKGLDFSPIAESLFSVTALGLPEPGGIPGPTSSSRAYLLLSAIAFIVFGAVFAAITRRKSKGTVSHP
jgi:hypothetical protein